MASAYSQPQTYLPYTPTTDLNLINTVLGAKQERYDAGVAQIDSLLQEFGNIDIAKESDKEYLYGKLKTLTDQVNKYGKLNFSNKDVTRNVKNHIKGALDERVINSIADTQKYRNYQATAEAAKKEGDYADLNYQVGLMQAGFTDWMNDETGQVRLGNLNYTPYEDVNSTLMKSLKEASAIKGGKRVIQVQDPTMPGRLIEKSIDGLTQAELQDIIPSLLNERGRAQLRVNGYYEFKGNAQSARDALKVQYDNKNNNIDTEITNLQTKIDSGKASTAQVQEFKGRITNLEAIKTKNLKQIDSIASGDASTIGGFLEEEKLTNSLSFALKAAESTEYVKDQAYFANLERQAKDREAALKQGTTTGAGVSGATSIPIATDQVDSFDFYDYIKKEGTKLQTDLTTTVNSQYNALNPTQKQKVDSLMQGEDYALLNDRDKRIKALKDSGFIDPEVEGDINRLERKYKNYLVDDEEAYQNSFTSTLNNPDLWDEFKDDSLLGNQGIKIIDSSAGGTTTIRQYLSNRGINSKEQYSAFMADPERSADFKQRILADDFLSTTVVPSLLPNDPTNNLGRAMLGNNRGVITIDKEFLIKFDRMKSIYGETDLNLEDVFNVYELGAEGPSAIGAAPGVSTRLVGSDFIRENSNNTIPQLYSIELNPNARDSKIAQVLQQTLRAGTFNNDSVIGEVLSTDNSVADDPGIRKALSVETLQKKYVDNVAASGIRVRGGNAIAVPPSMTSTNTNPIFEGVRNQMAQASPTFVPSDLQRGDRVPGYLDKLEYGVALQLRRDVSNPDQFIVTQGNKSAIIPVRALRNEPAVVAAIELDDGAQEIINENQEPIELRDMSFKPSNQKTNIYLGERYGFNSTQYLAATREGANILLEKSNPYLYSEQAPPEFAQTFQVALNNADKFEAVIQNYRGRTYAEVFYDGEKISEIAGIGRDRMEDFVDYDPQVFITTALTNIAEELKFKNNENFAKLYARIYGQ